MVEYYLSEQFSKNHQNSSDTHPAPAPDMEYSMTLHQSSNTSTAKHIIKLRVNEEQFGKHHLIWMKFGLLLPGSGGKMHFGLGSDHP